MKNPLTRTSRLYRKRKIACQNRSVRFENLEPRRLLTVTPETSNNDTLLQASPLVLTEDPVGFGFSTAFGTGTISPAVQGNPWSDPDYWRFEALAGDRISISMDTPGSNLDTLFELRTAADSVIANSNDDGPGTDAFLS